MLVRIKASAHVALLIFIFASPMADAQVDYSRILLMVAETYCDLPWGGTIQSGSSVMAFSSQTPPSACAAVAQTRTCSEGTLSGFYMYNSCTNGCTGTPWGAVSSGYSGTAYSSALPAGPCSSYDEVRTCTDGAMSGTFTSTTCTSGCTATPWGNVSSGYSNTAYSSALPASSCTSASQTRTCTSGTMSGTYTATSCTDGCTATPWGNVSSGYSNTAYSSTLPASSCASASQTRTCTAGTLSGTYTATACTNGCTGTPWGSVSSGYSNTAYSSNLPPGPCTSYDEIRTCTNGTMSGTYTNTTCTNGCTATPWGAVSSGFSGTAYSTTLPTSSCSTVSQTRTCTNGTMSGTYTNTTCTSGCTSTPWGNVASGYSNTAYSTSTPTTLCSNVSQTRTCTNGTMSGSYTITTCTSGCSAYNLMSGQSTAAGYVYSSSSSSAGCGNKVTLTCTSGSTSGTYGAYSSCTFPAIFQGSVYVENCSSTTGAKYWYNSIGRCGSKADQDYWDAHIAAGTATLSDFQTAAANACNTYGGAWGGNYTTCYKNMFCSGFNWSLTGCTKN